MRRETDDAEADQPNSEYRYGRLLGGLQDGITRRKRADMHRVDANGIHKTCNVARSEDEANRFGAQRTTGLRTGLSRRESARILAGMNLPASEWVALIVAVSFAAGLNVYATVATLGLLAHTGWLTLPPGLHLLENWYVIAASCALFGVEFFADKIPAFDLIWNALHTFIRVPIAALLAYQASAALSPGEQLVATIAGGLIALAAHGGKTAARAAVTPSPEPFSNMALSLAEDGLAVFLTWMATWKPYVAAGISLALVVFILVLVRWVWRALCALFRGSERAAM